MKRSNIGVPSIALLAAAAFAATISFQSSQAAVSRKSQPAKSIFTSGSPLPLGGG